MAKRILIIEDELPIAHALLRMLHKADYEAQHAADGSSGLALAKAQPFDLVLCDMQLPDMLGLDIQRSLRANAATAHLPLVFLTAMRDTATVREGLSGGAQLYLTKPFTQEELLDAIAEVLG